MQVWAGKPAEEYILFDENEIKRAPLVETPNLPEIFVRGDLFPEVFDSGALGVEGIRADGQ
jgi:hypothetical protein